VRHTVFVEKEQMADFQTASRLRRLVENKANRDDILAFFQERMLPVDEVEAESLADEVLRNPPELGYLTVFNALQWRLQCGRVIEQAGKVGGILRLV
jgi:Fe2+ or Zn2+ uptake regulation protein